MKQNLKILDMNLNRATEGLRTIEDIARLIRPDQAVASLVKSLRHQIGQAAMGLDRQDRLSSRNVRLDQGTSSQGATEQQRSDWQAIVSAAAERVTQSLRCLEEFSKPVSQKPSDSVGDLSNAFKQLRYRAYDDLAFAEQRLSLRAFPPAAKLYLLIDCRLPLQQFEKHIEKLSQAGVDIFQLRDKHAEAQTLVEYSRAVVKAIERARGKRPERSLFIVNDRVDVAVAVNADGVHLGQEDLDIRDARAILPAGKFVGISTHDDDQVKQGIASGADYIGCGPTFPSQTKHFESFSGLEFLESASQISSIPNYAIGGITLDTLPDVMKTGCTGVAVSTAINAEESAVAVAERFAKRLDELRS